MNLSLKKTAVISLCTAVLATNVSSSAFAVQTNQAADAVNLLSNHITNAKSALMAKLATIKYFSADFTQQILDADGNELLNASGTLAVKKPNLVHWNTAEPDESLIVSDGQTLWYLNPFIEQVSAFRLDKALLNTPILLLTSNDPELWQHYSVSSMNENNFLIHTNNNNSQVKTLELRFKKNTDKLDSFTILDATGQLSIFKLSKLDQDVPPDNALFKFIISEGIELDDQR
ncbi:MAG: outer membrane lipoprotein chaperone LolA [Colwellia sp.]|nr:outer membrane lipoprotein chaperone LolA [Colwellia sp.]